MRTAYGTVMETCIEMLGPWGEWQPYASLASDSSKHKAFSKSARESCNKAQNLGRQLKSQPCLVPQRGRDRWTMASPLCIEADQHPIIPQKKTKEEVEKEKGKGVLEV